MREPAPPAAAMPGFSRRRDPQDVADAADRVDQPGLAPDQLAPQVADVGLDDVAIAAEAVVPDVVEDLGPAQHPARVDHQVAQQLELVRRQSDLGARAPHLVAVLVEFEVGDHQPGACLRLAPAAPQHRPDPGQHLVQAERLGDVVVAAERETGDPLVDAVPGGQEDHRDPGAARADPADHVEAVAVGPDETFAAYPDLSCDRADIAAAKGDAKTAHRWYGFAASQYVKRNDAEGACRSMLA